MANLQESIQALNEGNTINEDDSKKIKDSLTKLFKGDAKMVQQFQKNISPEMTYREFEKVLKTMFR